MRGGIYFEGGRPVAAVEADVYFDERETGERGDPSAMAREMLNLVVGSPNPALQAEILALLLGVGFRGCTEQEIATRHRVTRAAVSARMVSICDIIGMQRPFGPMRTANTRKRCARSATMAHMN